MQEYAKSFNKGNKRAGNPENARLNTRTCKYKKTYKDETGVNVKSQMLATLKAMQDFVAYQANSK